MDIEMNNFMITQFREFTYEFDFEVKKKRWFKRYNTNI